MNNVFIYSDPFATLVAMASSQEQLISQQTSSSHDTSAALAGKCYAVMHMET